MFRQNEGKQINTKPLHEGTIMIHGNGVRTISYEMIRNRASELAVIDGRLAQGGFKLLANILRRRRSV